jgi:hypothetical protein
MSFTERDFNGGGVVDLADFSIFAGTYGQGILYYTSLAADLNGDNVVDGQDIEVVADNLGLVGAEHTDGDLNGDGAVDTADLDIMFAQYGLTIDYV